MKCILPLSVLFFASAAWPCSPPEPGFGWVASFSEPADGAQDVPLNARILIPSNPVPGDLEIELEIAGTEPTRPPFVHRDGLLVVTPASLLEAATDYILRLRYKTSDFAEERELQEIRFTTSDAIDDTPPIPREILSKGELEFNEALETSCGFSEAFWRYSLNFGEAPVDAAQYKLWRKEGSGRVLIRSALALTSESSFTAPSSPGGASYILETFDWAGNASETILLNDEETDFDEGGCTSLRVQTKLPLGALLCLSVAGAIFSTRRRREIR